MSSYRQFLLLCSFFLFTQYCFSQDEAASDSTIPDLYVHELVVPPDSIEAWRTDGKLAYLKNFDSALRKAKFKNEKRSVSPQATPPPGKKKKSQQSRAEEELEDDTSGRYGDSWGAHSFLASSGLLVIIWIAAVVLILYVLYKLFLKRSVFSGSTPNILAGPEVNDIERGNADFETLIQQSVASSDYRLAVRYLFLQTLQKLSLRGMINEGAEKTNIEYVHEIPSIKRNDFSKLVLNYEYAWYGKVGISTGQYSSLENDFRKFQNNI